MSSINTVLEKQIVLRQSLFMLNPLWLLLTNNMLFCFNIALIATPIFVMPNGLKNSLKFSKHDVFTLSEGYKPRSFSFHALVLIIANADCPYFEQNSTDSTCSQYTISITASLTSKQLFIYFKFTGLIVGAVF